MITSVVKVALLIPVLVFASIFFIVALAVTYLIDVAQNGDAVVSYH